MYEAGHPELVLWVLRGWDGEGCVRGVQNGGTHVYPWLIHVDVWQKPSQYCNYPPIKIKQLIKIIKVIERIVFLL